MRAARLGEQRAVEFMFVYRNPILASRSSAGVGITPPKVLAAPKPVSSVMMSRMFGAPLGGTTRGGHHGLDWRALRSIVPPNGGAGAGSWFPLMVVVPLGEPRVPGACCAMTKMGAVTVATTSAVKIIAMRFLFTSP